MQNIFCAGRNYLFDIGTGLWSSGSIKWFTTVYGARNIEFDEILGEHSTTCSCIRSRIDDPLAFASSLLHCNVYYWDVVLASTNAGWEITKTSPEEYWGAIPVILHSKMHWYNIPAAIDAQSPDNPWNIIKRIFRPGDLVAVKLVCALLICLHLHMTCMTASSVMNAL